MSRAMATVTSKRRLKYSPGRAPDGGGLYECFSMSAVEWIGKKAREGLHVVAIHVRAGTRLVVVALDV